MSATMTMTQTEGAEKRDELQTQPDEDVTPRSPDAPMSTLREVAFVTTLCFAQLLTQSSLLQAIAPLQIIGQSFHTENAGQLSWFAASYPLTVGTFILIAGRWGDIYGHKKMVLFGWAWFALWSVITGFSVWSNQIFFDVSRAFQGIGPAFLLPNALALFGRTFPPGKKKNMVFALFAACGPIGGTLGTVFSSIFAEFVWWPWAFWVTGMICFAFLLISFFAVPEGRDDVPVTHEKGELDLPGSATGVTGLVLINFAWNQGSAIGWNVPYNYVLLIVGTICIGAFFWVESRASHPLVPLRSLSSDAAFVLACVAAGWSTFGIWFFYTWQFLTVSRGASPLLAAAYLAPVPISGTAACLTTGWLLSKLRPELIMLCSMFGFTIGILLIATCPVQQTYWAQTFVSTIIVVWGMDMSFPSSTIILSNAMPRKHQGIAASLVNTIVNYSISLGLGFAGTIDSQVNRGGTDVLRGYRGAWYMGLGLSGLGILISLSFIISKSLRNRRAKATEKE